MDTTPPLKPAGFFRRLAAITYDLFLLTAVLFFYSAIWVGVNQGEAVTHPFFHLSLLLIISAFFVFFWTRKGQTLGMQSWRIRVIDRDGHIPNGKTAVLRLLYAGLSWAPCGLGYLWALIDKDKQTWHDKLSKTYLVYLPKKQR